MHRPVIYQSKSKDLINFNINKNEIIFSFDDFLNKDNNTNDVDDELDLTLDDIFTLEEINAQYDNSSAYLIENNISADYYNNNSLNEIKSDDESDKTDSSSNKRLKISNSLCDYNEMIVKFPHSLAYLLNNGNIKLLERYIMTYFHPNCVIKIRLPTICTLKQGSNNVLRLCQVILSSYPDCSTLLRSLTCYKDKERDVLVIKSKCFFYGTKVNKDIDGYTMVKRAALVDYMNQSKLTDEDRERLLLLESKILARGMLIQRYIKKTLRLIVDYKTGLFIGFDEKVTLSSFKEVDIS